jgi:type IX secretion system PorP/SprF family membrane protein
MKKYIYLIALSIVFTSASAQQLQTSSLYDVQGVLHNPAMAGMQSSNFVGASYRTQWSVITGSPKTTNVFGSFAVPDKLIGLGGYIYSDVTGPTSRTGAQFSFAKHLPMSDGSGKFSIGIETRLFQFGIDKNKLGLTLGNDPILAGAQTRTKFDAGLGLAFTNEKLQVGISVAQMVQSKLDFYTGSQTPSAQGRLYRHFYLHTNYRIDVGGGTTIVPNMLLIYLPSTSAAEFQAGARVERELFWWGVGIRSRQSYMLSAGLNINKNFSLGYGYDSYISPISTFDGGAHGHELLLRYTFKKK